MTTNIPTASQIIRDTQVRDSPDLAHEASHLSIDAPSKPTQAQLNAYIDELVYEGADDPQPFRSELATGYCYDVRMRYHCELDTPKDRRDYHPEEPRRIFAIYQELCVAGLINDPMVSKGAALISRPLKQIDARAATEAEIELVHDRKHWENMTATKSKFFILLSRCAIF